jgi:hypothetical protein
VDVRTAKTLILKHENQGKFFDSIKQFTETEKLGEKKSDTVVSTKFRHIVMLM